MFNIADWIGLATVISAAAAALGAAYWQSRKKADPEAERPYKPRPVIVELGDDTRKAIEGVRDALQSHKNDFGEAIDKHRRAVEDQTATIKRQT